MILKGVIRILVATIAFGLGVDCRAVHRTIHFGPSKNLEAFVQESGRAGRDGKLSFSYLSYHGLLLTHVEKDIKNFIHTKDCRSTFLLKEFNDTSAHTTFVDHLCCDNCSKICECGSVSGEERCVTTLITAAKETTSWHTKIQLRILGASGAGFFDII